MDFDKILELFLTNPDEAVNMVIEMSKTYKPMLYKVLNEFLDMYKDYVNNTLIQTYTAKDRMNYYKALIDAGFSEDQAFTILVNEKSKSNNYSNGVSKLNLKLK